MDTFPNLEAVESRLLEWATANFKLEVTFRMPDQTQPAGDQINFYLFDLLKSPLPAGGARRPPAHVALRYLATVNSPDSVRGRRLASELLFDAIDNPDLEIESEPVPPALWLALGVPPRPAFIFRIGLIRQREQPAAPLVTKFVVRSAAVVCMNGQVIGPGDTPIMNAVVELSGLKNSVCTDSAGRFAFSMVPAEPREVELVVKARGKEMSVRTAAHHSPENLVVVNFNLLEK